MAVRSAAIGTLDSSIAETAVIATCPAGEVWLCKFICISADNTSGSDSLGQLAVNPSGAGVIPFYTSTAGPGNFLWTVITDAFVVLEAGDELVFINDGNAVYTGVVGGAKLVIE